MEISFNTTEALITVRRIRKVVNIVVATVEDLDGDGVLEVLAVHGMIKSLKNLQNI